MKILNIDLFNQLVSVGIITEEMGLYEAIDLTNRTEEKNQTIGDIMPEWVQKAI